MAIINLKSINNGPIREVKRFDNDTIILSWDEFETYFASENPHYKNIGIIVDLKEAFEIYDAYDIIPLEE